jgi:hypothetical protein
MASTRKIVFLKSDFQFGEELPLPGDLGGALFAGGRSEEGGMKDCLRELRGRQGAFL